MRILKQTSQFRKDQKRIQNNPKKLEHLESMQNYWIDICPHTLMRLWGFILPFYLIFMYISFIL